MENDGNEIYSFLFYTFKDLVTLRFNLLVLLFQKDDGKFLLILYLFCDF